MMKRVFVKQMVFLISQKVYNSCVKYEQLTIFDQGFYLSTCLYSLWGIMGKSLDPTLNIH